MKRVTHVCDDCRTAFYDEGYGMSLSDEELATVLFLGADIGDHDCDASAGILNGTGCDCPCPKG